MANEKARRSRPATPSLQVIPYALERLFLDQDYDWVVDTVAPFLAWVHKSRRRQPFQLRVEHGPAGYLREASIELTWDEEALGKMIPGLRKHADRLKNQRSAQREHVTELAAYCLTFVAISIFMPGRRVVSMQMGVAPDILFDVSPGALRGVETAGRTSGGRAALIAVRNGTRTQKGKAPDLIARTDLAEVHLSLWCVSSRIGIMEQLKP